uniref:Uncharacterized protein n=1 Tax=Aegilops tauschii subsp. strangulata TaxID=200361 RepID=A0A452XVL6_AEGTS
PAIHHAPDWLIPTVCHRLTAGASSPAPVQSTPMATPTTSRLHHYLLPALPSRPPRTSSSSAPSVQGPSRRPTSRLYCSSPPVGAPPSGKGGEYRPSLADDFLLAFFRAKMVEEVGWDSQKPGYEGLIEVANRLMIKGKSASETEQSAVCHCSCSSPVPPLLP